MTAAIPVRVAPQPASQCDPADCRALWLAALEIYLRDVIAASRGSQVRHAREALEDLFGTRIMLARLCDPIDLTVEAVANAILARLE